MRKSVPFVLAVYLAAASCAINPVTGKRELSLISEQEEIALGRETDGDIRAQFGVYQDPALEGYIAAAGKALSARTHRPGLPYSFAVLDSPVVNAFAVPGGYVYVTRGILALMSSEAELAAVLGHELGHINARHSVRRMSEMMLVQTGLAVGSAVNETFAKLSGIAGTGIGLLFLKFSRDDERQADALGVEYSRAGGYDPGGMIPFFQALEKMGDLSGGQSLPGFLSTHPLTAERIQNAKDMLTSEDSRLARNPESYLKKIENMVYGEDPRQGFVEGGAFYHPLLKFRFAVPAGWKLENTASRVTLASGDGNGAVLLQAEKSGEALEEYARKRSGALKDGRLLGETAVTINGLAGYEQTFSLSQAAGEALNVRLSFIRKGDMVFTFSALSPAARFSGFEAEFRAITGSFRELTDPAFLNRSPKRVRLVRADGKQSLQEIFRKEGLPDALHPTFSIMNGLELKGIPERGRWVKTAR